VFIGSGLRPKSGAGIPVNWGCTSQIWGRTSANLGLHFRWACPLSTALQPRLAEAARAGFLRNFGAAVPTRPFAPQTGLQPPAPRPNQSSVGANLGLGFRPAMSDHRHLAARGWVHRRRSCSGDGAIPGPAFRRRCRHCNDLARTGAAARPPAQVAGGTQFRAGVPLRCEGFQRLRR